MLCVTALNAQMMQHTVKRGETEKSIAAYYGKTVSDLRQKNPRLEFYRMAVGDVLFIPVEWEAERKAQAKKEETAKLQHSLESEQSAKIETNKTVASNSASKATNTTNSTDTTVSTSSNTTKSSGEVSVNNTNKSTSTHPVNNSKTSITTFTPSSNSASLDGVTRNSVRVMMGFNKVLGDDNWTLRYSYQSATRINGPLYSSMGLAYTHGCQYLSDDVENSYNQHYINLPIEMGIRAPWDGPVGINLHTGFQLDFLVAANVTDGEHKVSFNEMWKDSDDKPSRFGYNWTFGGAIDIFGFNIGAQYIFNLKDRDKTEDLADFWGIYIQLSDWF